MRSTITEAWLETHKWEFDYQENIPLDSVVMNETAKFQIRLDNPIDSTWVERLTHAIHNGDSLPAIVLVKFNKRLEMGDGIHRYTAFRKEGKKTIDAYIVTNVEDEKQLEHLRRTVNTQNGKSLTAEEAVTQAFMLYQSRDITIAAAAKEMNVNEGSVAKRVRAAKTRTRIAFEMPKANGVGGLTQDALDFIGRIRRSDLFQHAVQMIVKNGFTSQQIKAVVTPAFRVSTDQEAQQLLQKWTHMFPPSREVVIKKPAANRSPDMRLERAISELKAAVTKWDNHVDFSKLSEKKQQEAIAALLWAKQEFAARAESAVQGRDARHSRTRGRGKSGRNSSHRSTAHPA